MKVLSAASALLGVSLLRFAPDTTGIKVQDYNRLPLTWDLATSQNAISNTGNSWWSSSYIHASNGRNYFLVSHVGNPGVGFYRYSILDIDDPSYYRQYSLGGTESDPISDHVIGANITLPTYGFQALDAGDTLQSMRTWSTSGFIFDLTFNLSSAIIVNGGSGTFTWGPYLTYEWSMPAGITTGSFVVNDTRLTIDPERSLTWYDRQLVWGAEGSAAAHNWTWFQLHFDDDDNNNNNNNAQSGRASRKISAWIWNYEDNARIQFATIRDIPGEQHVVPLTQFTPGSRVWTSPDCGGPYHLDWTIALEDGTELDIATARPDQLFCGPTDPTPPAYEGFVTFTGVDGDGRPVSGFGLVEITLSNLDN
ncbi:uncharacterized protein BJX67DRAFT_377551 [Aspergillus lucknowensis]|uniref:Kievitone hydratase n=1 Tax=Aspergillus lucknowensis TaxID=176173 RepID=A0ABR4M326_9EURO